MDASETHSSSALDRQADSSEGPGMILIMGGIGLIAGILIVLTFQWTSPRIKANQARALERAIFDVVPGAETTRVFTRVDEVLRPLQGEADAAEKYYACYDRSHHLVGVAVEARGQGFQDVVRLLYGYSPQRHCIVGLAVLESKETPGLGDRIKTEAAFRSNFEALAVPLNPEKTEVVHPITLVKQGKKTQPWQIEAITGATISSRAVAEILRKSMERTAPMIMKNLVILEAVRKVHSGVERLQNPHAALRCIAISKDMAASRALPAAFSFVLGPTSNFSDSLLEQGRP